MGTFLNEKIKVGVIFKENGGFKLLWFKRQEQFHQIKKITYCWTSYQGEAKIYHFSVLDQHDNLFELCYNTRQLYWILRQAES